MRLGSRTVRDMALAFSLVSGHRSGKCEGFDYKRYWSLSLARAVAAQAVARANGGCKPEEAYICALLADIGLLALASVNPESYTNILATVGRSDFAEMRRLEGEQFDIDHGQVAVCMLEEWGLPAIFGEAISAFTKAREVDSRKQSSNGLAEILRFAEVLAELVSIDERSSLSELASIGKGLERVREGVDMEEAAFTVFVDAVIREWVTWGESLNVETASDLKCKQLLERLEDARARLDAGEKDSVRPAFDRRRSESEEPEPEEATAPEAEEAQAPEPASVQPATPVVEASSGAAPIRILAIDDDPVTLKILVKHLENSGYEVMQARDGAEGLQMALEHDPEVVMSDWVMPELDGLQLCQELRRTDSGRSMYFLLVTGRIEEERIVEAFEAGVDDYITKPFIPRILAARIKGAARLVDLQRQVDEDRKIMRQQVAEMGQLTRKLRSAALTDALTELPNRRYAMKRMDNEWASVKRTGRPLTLIMMDIDHFKSVNDTYGHDIGDIVLQETAKQLTACVRDSDEVCRIGGEEFLVICKNTMQADGMLVAERIRAGVEAYVIDHPAFGKNVTLSLGVAGTCEANGSVSDLLKKADEAVYEAKHGGRNQACGAPESGQQRKSA